MREKGADNFRSACIPTMPTRMDIIEAPALSIARQVDVLYLYCNGKCRLPGSLLSVKNIVPITDEPDRGSAGRFVLLGMLGYLFFCDDDLIYPDGYADMMISAIEHYGRDVVVSLHGKVTDHPMVAFNGFGPGKILKSCACLRNHADDMEVDLIGTGCMAAHSSTLKGLLLRDIIYNNLDDAEFSIRMHERGIPMVALAHTEGYLKYVKPNDKTIWEQTVENPKPLLDLINGFDGWRLYGIRTNRQTA